MDGVQGSMRERYAIEVTARLQSFIERPDKSRKENDAILDHICDLLTARLDAGMSK